jgi:hypothetical protein
LLVAFAAACSAAPASPSNLEDAFPDEIAGHQLQVTSASGEGVITQFAQSNPEGFRNFISGLGANMDQVSAAISFNIWPVDSAQTDFTGLTMVAMRIAGVPATTVVPQFVNFVKEDVGDAAQVTQETVAGKSVTAVRDPEDAENTAFLYPSGDIVFLVGGTPAHVEEALSKLP